MTLALSWRALHPVTGLVLTNEPLLLWFKSWTRGQAPSQGHRPLSRTHGSKQQPPQAARNAFLDPCVLSALIPTCHPLLPPLLPAGFPGLLCRRPYNCHSPHSMLQSPLCCVRRKMEGLPTWFQRVRPHLGASLQQHPCRCPRYHLTCASGCTAAG